MKKLLNKIFVDGYNPFNFFNLILSAVNGTIFAIFFMGVIDGYSISEMLRSNKDKKYLLVAIACFLLLLFRNRKLKSIPKMIIFTVLSSVLGIVFALVGFILFMLLAFFGGVGDKLNLGGNSGGQKWTEQFSQTKGTYYSDGQGNFKDQYGNDVYNPQGVSDYDKL